MSCLTDSFLHADLWENLSQALSTRGMLQAIMDNVGEAVRKSMHDLGNYALIRNADQAHNTAHR